MLTYDIVFTLRLFIKYSISYSYYFNGKDTVGYFLYFYSLMIFYLTLSFILDLALVLFPTFARKTVLSTTAFPYSVHIVISCSLGLSVLRMLVGISFLSFPLYLYT